MNAILHKWYKALLAILLVLVAHSVVAQQVTVSHKAGWFYIPDSLSLHIKGGLSSLEGNEEPLLNQGQMYISDSISCFGDNKIFGNTPDTATADIYLNGDTTQIIYGYTPMRFGNLYVQNTYDTVELYNDVQIYHFIDLQQGNIYVHDFNALDLINTGVLIGERNQARVFGGNYGELKLTRPLLFGQKYSDIGGIGFGLTVNGNLGISTEITRKNVSQINVSNGSIQRFYSFKPEKSAYVSEPEIIYLDSTELNGNAEENLEFYVSNTSGNTWTKFGGQVDAVNHRVQSVGSEPFVLSEQTMLSVAESKCLAAPYIHFERDTIPLCGGSPAWLRPEGIVGMSSIWSNGVQNKDSILVDKPGIYLVTITDVYGCTNIDSVVVIDAPVPNVQFSVDPVCVGTTTVFENESDIASGELTYQWNLGDLYTEEEDTSTLENPEITYENQGIFPVTLRAESNYGCVSEIEKTARVNAYPVVAFSMENDCADSLVQFTNLTRVAPDTTIEYTWDFGDELSSNDSTPLHAYQAAGAYQVKLTAISLGCESELIQEINIHPNPVAAFASNDVCLGEEMIFENQSTVPSESNTYQWQFDDQNSAVIEDVNYTFEAAGEYAVKLKATTNEGCMHDTTVLMSVFALPQAEFSVEESCENAKMQFTNSGDASSSYKWNFNDEGVDSILNPEFAFGTYGTKQIMLTETDSNGCVASINKEVKVKAMPTVDFISTDGCEGEELSFINKSSSPEGSLDYNWYVDNAMTDDGKNFTNSFNNAGSYAIKLVANNDGCVDSVEYNATINPTAVVDLGTEISTCAEQYILDAQNAGSLYNWSDASSNQELTAIHSGTYWVEVTTDKGCVTKDTVKLNLKSTVTPHLGADATFCDYAELNAGYPGASYEWSTGETTQSITISNSGEYWVKVTDQNGCFGADTIIATVVSSVIPDLGQDLSACEGQVLNLETGTSSYNYQWNTGENSATINVEETGTFWCQLTDNNGCISHDTINVKFNANPTLDLGLDQNYCDKITFDISGSNLSYQWDNGETLSKRTIHESGNYWAKVTDNATGCVSSDTVAITVSESPIVDIGEDYNLCNGSSALLDAENAGSTYRWNVGDITQSITASASGLYSVAVTSAEGCVTSDTIAVTIDDPLDTYLGEDFVLCDKAVAEISSPIVGAATYEWVLNDSALNLNQQTVVVDQQGTLSVTVFTEKGCSVSDTIVLLSSPTSLEANYLAATENIYVGDTIQFINLSQAEPYTSYWDFGDGYFDNQNSPDHIYYFQGKYKAMLEISNGVCADTISKQILVLPQRPPEQEDIKDVNEILSINAYPNPATDEINLNLKLKMEDEVIIECINIYGIFIFNDLQYGETMNINYQVTDYTPGIYFLRIRIPDQTMFIKFIKN